MTSEPTSNGANLAMFIWFLVVCMLVLVLLGFLGAIFVHVWWHFVVIGWNVL